MDVILSNAIASTSTPTFQPVRFLQWLLCDGLPAERVGDHLISIAGPSGGEVARAKVAFEYFTARFVYSTGVACLFGHWAETESLAKRTLDARAFLSTTPFPSEWHDWLGFQLLLHYIALDESRRLGRKVTVETAVDAPLHPFHFQRRANETCKAADWLDCYFFRGGAREPAAIEAAGAKAGHSADELRRAAELLDADRPRVQLESRQKRRALYEATHANRPAGRALKKDGIHLALAVQWFFDKRGPTAAAAGRVDGIGRSDPAKNVKRARQDIKRLLDLVTLEFPPPA